MSNIQELKESGDWWTNPWWKKEGLQLHCEYPISEVDECGQSLREYFDAAWAKDIANNPRHNLVFVNLCIGNSTSALHFIVFLGRALSELKSSEGVQRIIKALKGEKSKSALLELRTAYVFSESGRKVAFPIEGREKSPDILVDLDGIKIAVECKSLNEEVWEDTESNIMSAVMDSLPTDHKGKKLSIQTHLNTRLTQAFLSREKEPEIHISFVRAVVERVNECLETELLEKAPPFTIEVSGIASLHVSYEVSGTCSGISGMERAAQPITRRVLQNAVLPACEQIPESTPGIVVAYAPFIPDKEFFRVFFEAMCKSNTERFGYLMALVVIPLQTIMYHQPVLIFKNPFTICGSEQALAIRAFEEHMGAVDICIHPDFQNTDAL